MKNFTVYGGCISRDVFNYLDNTIYHPTLTIGQNPISTMFESPISINLEDYTIGKNFEKRMLYYDANKLALNKIVEHNNEYFIFDVICERITVMKLELNNQVSFVEKSWLFVDNFLNMVKTEQYKGLKKIEDIDVLELDDSYEKKIDLFCDKIKKKFPKEKIIFLQCRLVDEYLDKNNDLRKFNVDDGYKIVSNYNIPEYGNKVLKRVEKRIKKNLPNIHYISMPEGVLASENHHFGLHPLYYTDDYYKYVAEAIKMIVDLKKPELTEKPLQYLCELQSHNNLESKKILEKRQCILDYFPQNLCDWKILNPEIWNTFEYDKRLVLYPNEKKYGRIFLKLNKTLKINEMYFYDIKWKVVSTKKVRLMLACEATVESPVNVIAEQEVTGTWQRIQGQFFCTIDGMKYLMLSSTDFLGQGAMLSFEWIRIYEK